MQQKEFLEVSAAPVEDAIRQMLEPYFGDFSECVQDGWQAWERIQRQIPDSCKSLRSPTIASIVFDNIIESARKIFRKYDKNVVVMYDDVNLGFPVLDFAGKLCVRFKKLRHNFKPSNVKTNRQKGLEQQLLTLDGIPLVTEGAVWLTAGYRLNASEDAIKDISIVCWHGETLWWRICLPLSQTVPMQHETAEVPETQIVPKAQIKRSIQKQA